MTIYDPANYDLRNAVGPLIGRTRAAFMAALDERLAAHDLKAADYIVLVALANDIDTASGLCLAMSHDPGAMTRKIDALEKRGLVRRARSSEDRRAIKLELTPEGRKVYPKALATAIGVANDFLRGFSKVEVRQLEGMLKRILANAEALELAGSEVQR